MYQSNLSFIELIGFNLTLITKESVHSNDPVREGFLAPKDFTSSGYYGHLATYDTAKKDWEYQDSDGNVCLLKANING